MNEKIERGSNLPGFIAYLLYFCPGSLTRGNCSIAGHSGFGMPSGEDAEWPIGFNADLPLSQGILLEFD